MFSFIYKSIKIEFNLILHNILFNFQYFNLNLILRILYFLTFEILIL